jgi:hypothetical protein
MVRTRIAERHRERLESLFTPQGKRPENPENLEALRRLLS